MIEIDKAKSDSRRGAVNDVVQSLSSGRGPVARGLRQGFKTERNVR